MTEQLDVRGLSCPQPIFKVEEAMKRFKCGSFEVISDCGTSRANILRHAAEKGWKAEDRETDEGDYLILLSKD